MDSLEGFLYSLASPLGALCSAAPVGFLSLVHSFFFLVSLGFGFSTGNCSASTSTCWLIATMSLSISLGCVSLYLESLTALLYWGPNLDISTSSESYTAAEPAEPECSTSTTTPCHSSNRAFRSSPLFIGFTLFMSQSSFMTSHASGFFSA